jgi:hypothetical protein
MENANNGEAVTEFENICSILSDLWLNYKHEKDFRDFISYNDIGLPLAYFIASELVEATEMAKQYVYETWNIFLDSLDVKEDIGWNSLEELFFYVDNEDKE